MCTVTFIPVNDTVFITSNRDEHHTRSKAAPPAWRHYENSKLLFPKDLDAGGTWIVLKEKGDAAVLLNGAFEKHTPTPPYKRSRGLVLLEVMQNENPLTFLKSYMLQGIEPFTLVLFVEKRLYEFQWDGAQTFFIERSLQQGYIWLSVTLYDAETIRKRERWFATWLQQHSQPDQQDVLQLHCKAVTGDGRNDWLMNHNGIIRTMSITSIALAPQQASMTYWDVVTDEQHIEHGLTGAKTASITSLKPVT